jgi:hypothetical protein
MKEENEDYSLEYDDSSEAKERIYQIALKWFKEQEGLCTVDSIGPCDETYISGLEMIIELAEEGFKFEKTYMTNLSDYSTQSLEVAINDVAKGVRDSCETIVCMEIDRLHDSAFANRNYEVRLALMELKRRIQQMFQGMNAKLSDGQ